jgi:YHS domain-containing protein
MKKIIVMAVGAVFFSACAQHPKTEETKKEEQMHTGSATAVYTLDMVDNKKDFSCGMPLTAGIADTAHYKGKVYGFCSTECKEDFLKNAEAYLNK